jgi:hypothetical protein
MPRLKVTSMRSTYLDRHTRAQHSSPYQRYYNAQHSPPCLSLNSRSYSLYALACDKRIVWIARYCPCPGVRMLGAPLNGTLYVAAIALGSLIVFHHFTCTWSRQTWSYVLWNWKLMFCLYLPRCNSLPLGKCIISWVAVEDTNFLWSFAIFVQQMQNMY